jgi:hypothetical protein
MKVGIRVVICKGSTTGYDKLGAPVVPKGRAGGEDEAGDGYMEDYWKLWKGIL